MSLCYGENLIPTDNWFVIFDETEEHVAKRRKLQNKALIPQVPKQLEDKIMNFVRDLAYMERHQGLTQRMVMDFHKQVHQFARADCWCAKTSGICKCIHKLIMPQRITRARRSYWGYGYRDLVLDWTWKIRNGRYILRCTACISVCECTSYFPQHLRNGQRITHDFCDGRLLSWVTKGRKECFGKSKENKEMCTKCRGTKLMWTDYLRNSEINIRY